MRGATEMYIAPSHRLFLPAECCQSLVLDLQILQGIEQRTTASRYHMRIFMAIDIQTAVLHAVLHRSVTTETWQQSTWHMQLRHLPWSAGPTAEHECCRELRAAEPRSKSR